MQILYGANNRLGGTQQSLTTTHKTLVAITSSATGTRRGAVVDFSFGTDSTPNATHCTVVYNLVRITTSGAATSVTPNPNDNSAVAANALVNINHTTEPTSVAAGSLFQIAINQRASQRIVCRDDQHFMWAATSHTGLGLGAFSPVYAAQALAQVYFYEF